MIQRWTVLSTRHRLAFFGLTMVMCLLGMYLVIWQEMDHSIEMLQQEVVHLDQERQGLLPKIRALQAMEREITELRDNLSSRVRQFPEKIDSKTFRRDVVTIAKRRSVTVRVWKPEGPLMGLQQAETTMPITLKIEGDFQATVQFLDELRQLSWVESIVSVVMASKQVGDDSAILLTHIAIHGVSPLGMAHVQKLLQA
jgi:Tfp pilus assembly protein PilO